MAEEHLTARTGPGAPTDLVIARFPAQRLFWAVAAGYVLAMVIPAVMLIQRWRTHDWVQVVLGGFLLALPIPVIWLAVRLAGTSAFLTKGFVSTPRLWGRRVVPLAEVTGVGLRYVPVLDWDYLAQTPQGQTARAIYKQALTVQGPHGPLATQARQRNARSPGSFETAYWSPDGAIGAIRNGEPEAPQ